MGKKIIEKTCLSCGKIFFVEKYRKDTAKYCSRECHDIGQVNQKIVKCEWCGKEVKLSPSKIKKHKHHFCSLACVGKWNGQRNSSQIKKTCVICGKEYEVAPYRDKDSVTCSVKCQNEWQSKYRVRENNPRWKGGDILVTCQECGKFFPVSHYRATTKDANHARFCSLKCKHDYWEKNVISTADFQKKKLIGNMKLLSSNKAGKYRETAIEKAIRIFLEESKIEHKTQYVIGGKFCVDFYLPKHNIIIEALGDYWHGNPIKYNKDNLNSTQIKSMNRDKARFAYFDKCGFISFKLWETDIKKDINKVMKPIMDCIRTLETDITDTLTRV